MKSLSEIETISKRASRAAGFSWGESEEIGKGIRFLELFGLDGITNLNQYLNLKTKKKFKKIKIINKTNLSKKYPICPIILGINYLDQIRAIEKKKKIRFCKVSHPLLTIPFLSRGSELIGRKIFIKFDQIELLLNFNINVSTNLLNKKFPALANNLEISILENKNNFTAGDWKNLYKLSEKTFVDETESLKKNAAGAGLSDND